MKTAVKQALDETIAPMIERIGDQIKALVEGANARLAKSESKLDDIDERLKRIEQNGHPTPDPSVFERLDALEAARRRHDDAIEMIHTRLERHRRRIRWLERLAHWHGWFRPNPNP